MARGRGPCERNKQLLCLLRSQGPSANVATVSVYNVSGALLHVYGIYQNSELFNSCT